MFKFAAKARVFLFRGLATDCPLLTEWPSAKVTRRVARQTIAVRQRGLPMHLAAKPVLHLGV
jgi:hypothetical protein